MKVSDGYTASVNACNLSDICNTKVFNKMSYIYNSKKIMLWAP